MNKYIFDNGFFFSSITYFAFLILSIAGFALILKQQNDLHQRRVFGQDNIHILHSNVIYYSLMVSMSIVSIAVCLIISVSTLLLPATRLNLIKHYTRYTGYNYFVTTIITDVTRNVL